MMNAFCLIATLLVCLTMTGMARADGRTWYISPDGDDNASGRSLETALRTPQAAHDRTEPGDTVLVAEGEYLATEGSGLLVITRSGEPGNPIRYAPLDGHRVIFRVHGAWHAVLVSGASHIVIDGFVVRGNARNVTLEEARREMNNRSNPWTSGNAIGVRGDRGGGVIPTHVIVRNCDIGHFGGGGIYAVHADRLIIENNTVHSCGLWSPYANSGISIYQPIDADEYEGYKIIIRNNVAFGNYNHIPFYFSNRENPERREVTDGNGIIVDDYLHTQAFIGAPGAPYRGRTLIVNNIVFDNGGSGIHSYLGRNIDIVHNYAYGNSNHPQLRKGGQIFSNNSRNVRILNNVKVALADGPVNSNWNNDETVIYDHNVYWSTDGSEPHYTRDLASNIIADPGVELSDWSAGERKFTIAPDSPLRGAAARFPDAGPDFHGNPRPTDGADIGPFQRSAQPRQ